MEVLLLQFVSDNAGCAGVTATGQAPRDGDRSLLAWCWAPGASVLRAGWDRAAMPRGLCRGLASHCQSPTSPRGYLGQLPCVQPCRQSRTLGWAPE